MEQDLMVGHRVPYVVFYVDDLARSVAFYKRLGLEQRAFPIASTMGSEAAALSLQGTTLLLISKAAGAKYFTGDFGALAPAPGHAYPSFPVANLDAFHAAASAKAEPIECLQAPSKDGFGRMAIYRDPDGLLFTVVEPAAKAETHGLAISGGGALGAFELGVLEALAAQGLQTPSVITGTSVGAFNAAVLACRLGEGMSLPHAVGALKSIWRSRVAGDFHDNGVFRFRGDVMRFVQPDVSAGRALHELAGDAGFITRDLFTRAIHAVSGPGSVSDRMAELVDFSTLFSTEPLNHLISSNVDFSSLAKSPAAVRIATTDWMNGKLALFSHMPGRGPSRRYPDEITAANFHSVVQASTAIPGVFPTVEVHSGDRVIQCADGGLVMNSPLNPAIDAGARVVHLMCVSPEVNQLPVDSVSNTVETMTRALVAAVAGFISSDLERAKLVNRIAGIVRRPSSDEFYEPVTIHRYHPTIGNLGGIAGLLDFSLEHVDALIEDGLRVGRTHDCGAAGCVLAR